MIISVCRLPPLPLFNYNILGFKGQVFSPGRFCHILNYDLYKGHNSSYKVNDHHGIEPQLFQQYNTPRLYQIASRNYAMKQELKEYGLLWNKPEKIPSWKPEMSGDLKPYEIPDKSRPVVTLTLIKDEIAKADDDTKRLLSIEFSSASHALKLAQYDKIRQIQRHFLDIGSIEVRVAKMTTTIRRFQQKLPTVYRRKPKINMKVKLDIAINRRRKYLKVLGRYDYKKFEWLLENLDITFKPIQTIPERMERKDSLKKLVKMHCDDIVQKKLDDYKKVLESQKEPFLKEKEESFKWIKEMEEKYSIKEEEPPNTDTIKGRFRNLILSPKAMKNKPFQ